ncbi:CocE/NonD family hydrolase [soil metagenome]
MPDGVELAATLYLPESGSGPQPCLLEALPYRKDDLTSSYAREYVRLRDEYGYAVCRLDLRGTGSSGGDATDEYPSREQADLALVIAWLADQPWCTGNIGMWGTSYSGFNSLQMACEQPPALKAIGAIYATDDRWTDDVHWRGGALKFLDLVDYCHYMTPMNALPPVPALWGEGWHDEWRRRIDANEPWVLTWLDEQTDGPYWRHGSVAPDYDRIECAVMIVAGWADGYRNNSFRTAAELREAGVPHRLLAGPWAHAAPGSAIPGPRIDLGPEMVAWWNRWLRGGDGSFDDGLEGRPAMSAFIRQSTPPEPDLSGSAGYWAREEWPCPRVSVQGVALDGRPPYVVRADTGTAAWIDCAGHLPWGPSTDQRFDDAASLRWEWDGEQRVLLGYPVLRIRLSVDRPAAYLSAKLCDVFADGTSALIARGSLNLAYRTSRTAPSPLEPGQQYDIEVPLDACAYQLAEGQTLRLSVAGADWPNTAAPPGPVTLTIHGGELLLPVWSGGSPHQPPVLTPGGESGEDATGVVWRVERDVLRRETACVINDGASHDVPYDGTASEHYAGRVSVDTRTFGQQIAAEARYSIQWPEVSVSTRATLDLHVSAESYALSIDLEAYEGDDLVAQRRWHQTIIRGS